MRIAWLALAIACAAAMAGCGSASTGRPAPKEVIAEVERFAGPDAKVYQGRVLRSDSGNGPQDWLSMVVACKPDGGCELIAPDGVGYADLQEFADDSEFVKSGDRILGAENITSPGEPGRLAGYTKRFLPPWAWYTGGGALLLVLGLAGVWLVLRIRRRRRDNDRLLRSWDTPPEPEA